MIIVLGATGTIGQLLIKQLEQNNQKHVVIARSVERATKIFPPNIIRYGDLDKPQSLTEAFKGGTSLFLLSGHGEGMEAQQHSAIDAATRAGIKRIVKISGCEASIGLHAKSETGREHYRIEQHLKKASDDYVILRCNFFMQNLLDQAASMVKSKNKIMMPFSKDTIFSFIDAQDIAACAAQALIEKKYSGKTFYLTGQPSSFLDLSKTLSQHLPKPVTYKKVPLWLVKIIMRLKGNSARHIRHQLEMARLFMLGAGTKSTNSVNEILGQPPVALNNFIKRSINHFQ
ncbi:MAG: NmrA family NAD(P)-binding protein [Bermanella sp.]